MAFRDEGRVLSRPVRLRWAGWESDTFSLQRAGWDISAEQDIMRHQMMLALRAPNGAAYGISQRVNMEYMREPEFSLSAIDLGVQMQLGRDVMVHHHSTALPSFGAIDALPHMTTQQRVRLEDFAHFAPSPLVRNNPIVVPEESVSELMERILQLQQPDRTARIKAALRDPTGYDMSSLPQTTFQAQILSFNRAA